VEGHVTDIERDTLANEDYRRVLYTGPHLQLVLMTLAPGEEIGQERHEGHDQFIKVEAGTGKALLDGSSFPLKDGSSVVIPSGTEHNVVNTSKLEQLRLYTLYGPPDHPDGTVHRTKADESPAYGGAPAPQPGSGSSTSAADARMRARALSRWEGEGGALGRGASPSDALDDGELRILARIGRAALAQWGALPATVREAMLGSICRPLAPGDGAHVKAGIAAFLRENANR
jgi:mannose-6-phosphate isomerase-like protein (cupin superfamily)